MPTDWLRQPTGDGIVISEDGRAYVVRWVAGGYTTPDEALTNSTFPVEYNDPHPDESSGDYKCDGIRIIASQFKVISVEATYSIPEDGFEHRSESPNQEKPLVFSWSTVQESVLIDRDRDGNAILYTSLRPAGGLTQTRNYKRLVISRWEASYSVSTSLAYENYVNSAVFEGGVIGSVKCAIIQPSQSYTLESALIPIDYIFDFKAVSVWGEHPWQTQFVDQDSIARKSGGDRVKIVTKNGEDAGIVPLNGAGKPVDTTLTYFADPLNAKPEGTPAWVELTAGEVAALGATVIAAGSIKHLRYNTVPAVDFNVLGF